MIKGKYTPEYSQPWKTIISKMSVVDFVDLDALAGEIFTLDSEWDTDVGPNPSITSVLTPNIIKLRDEIITPAVLAYVNDIFDFEYDPSNLVVHTKGLTLRDNDYVGAHFHSAASFTTIFYPANSQAKLMLIDPRGNACRGYPRGVRKKHFDDIIIDPMAGDLYILPSYIAHQVTPVKSEFRTSLINDYFLGVK